MAGGTGWRVAPFTFTIPPGAAPGDARITIGPDVPADLTAKYATIGETIVGGIIFYRDANFYDYMIETSAAGLANLCVGARDGLGRIGEDWALRTTNGGGMIRNEGRFSTVIGALISTDRYNNNLVFKGPAQGSTFTPQLKLEDADIVADATSEINLLSGALLRAHGTTTDHRITITAGAPSTLELAAAAGFVIDSLSAPRGMRNAMSSDNGTLATSAGPGFAETAVAAANWDQEPTFTFKNGRLYRCTVCTAVINSAATATIAILRVRKGSASTAGTQLMYWEYACAAGFAGAGLQSDHVGYIKNTSGADVATKLSFTVDQAAGAGNMSIYGDANRPVIVAIEDIGIATEQPGIADRAVSV